MPRLLPSVEVRPLAGVVLYALIILVILGALFAGGGGGAVVWITFWVVVALVVYAVVSKCWGSIT